MDKFDRLIAALDEWVKFHRPAYHAQLEPGAAAADIVRLESHLGAAVGSGLSSLLRWRNGQSLDCFTSFTFNFQLMSVDQMIEAHHTLTELLELGEFKHTTEWWSRWWVPFLDNGGGDYMCLDLAAEHGGRSGQVLRFLHDDPRRKVEFGSFGNWLLTTAEGFRIGFRTFERGFGFLSPEEGAAYQVFHRKLNPGYPLLLKPPQ